MLQTGWVSISTAVPVGQPLYGASFGQAVKRFFRGYVAFSGRASRSEFWWAMLFTFLVSLVVQIPFWIAYVQLIVRTIELDERLGSNAPPEAIVGPLGAMVGWLALLLVVALALLLPTYAVMWRRLQDANFHGAIALASLVGFGIVPLVMCALPSSPAGVQYDPAYRAQMATYGYPQPYGLQPYGQQPYGQQPFGQQPQQYSQPTQHPYSQGSEQR